jgi:valyl-tRNA synthetase
VRDHLIRFFPVHWEKVYEQWLTNIQDWCISRQVWWGHRIPAWYGPEGEIRVQLESPGDGWRQDDDTLDTWFSSWLWAYETMDAETRAKFYPTSVLVTGPDIIFFWVARMIMAGLEFRPGKSERIEDNIAFRDVYFTGLIRDRQRPEDEQVVRQLARPLDLMAKYGADWLAFRPDADRAERAGHPVRREADRGRAELRDEALECRASPPDARRLRAKAKSILSC